MIARSIPLPPWRGPFAVAALAWIVAPAGAQGFPDKDVVDKDHAAKMAKGLDVFKTHVRAVLVEKCVKCHGAKATTDGGLDLTDRDSLLKGGESGPAVLVGKGKDSLMVKLVAHLKEPHMPHQGRKLPAEVAGRLAEWIDLGAPYDAPLVTRAAAKKDDWTTKVVPAEARQWWSFRPLRRATPPAVGDESWCRTPIDRFILAKQEAVGLRPNPPADRRRLIRRAFFDLTGLPPSPAEVEVFVRDPDPDAYPKLIDRLLSSPRYGERWARHWLDLARFAESHGFEHDSDRPTAYPYRDFVIRAFNQGMPYDRFVKWQIAGDEYAPDDKLALTATGYLGAGVHSTQITKNEVERHRYDELDDKLATVGTSLLGLTFGCARCHDHKYDPIPAADYYRMLATFTTTVRTEVELDFDPEGFRKAKAAWDREHEPLVAAVRAWEAKELPARFAEWEKTAGPNPPQEGRAPPAAVAQALKAPRDKRTPEQSKALLAWYRARDPEWRRLDAQVQAHKKQEPTKPKAMICSEGLPPVRLHSQGEDFLKETHFLSRGDPNQKAGVAAPGFLQVLAPADADRRWRAEPPAGWRTSYRRRAFAEWLTDAERGAGGLLARVMANRLWQRHMGRGLVSTVSDFGTRGEKPTHPELLDWLAVELVADGWQLKPMHKLLMTSAAYMQDSALDETKRAVDRDNRLWGRRPALRLEGEAIRDALLAVGGALDGQMYGPGTLDEASRRRSVYFTVKRSKLIPMLQVFDAPDALSSLGERPTTTIAPQALYLMNNPQVRAYAHGFAKRLLSASAEDAPSRGYLIALGRPPSPEELSDALGFVKGQEESYAAAGRKDARELALTDFCQTLMCLNEFVYVE